MLSAASHLMTAFGLASASGLNAYIPLLLVALTARLTPWLQLSAPFDILTHDWVIAALVVLLAVETVVDKIPAADTINDVFQTVVRPTAGAILFAANTNVVDLHPAIAVILGLTLAFGVHAVKATARPAVTASTLGAGNGVVSVVEDVVALVASVVALAAPILFGLFALLFVVWLIRRRYGRRPAMTRG